MALSEGKYTGEFILTELDGTISRDTVTITVPAATLLKPGQVLGVLTIGGKYVPYDDANTDGSGTAKAINYAPLDNSGSVAPVDFEAVVIDFAAEVRGADLVWGGADPVLGAADLFAVGIKVRG